MTIDEIKKIMSEGLIKLGSKYSGDPNFMLYFATPSLRMSFEAHNKYEMQHQTCRERLLESFLVSSKVLDISKKDRRWLEYDKEDEDLVKAFSNPPKISMFITYGNIPIETAENLCITNWKEHSEDLSCLLDMTMHMLPILVSRKECLDIQRSVRNITPKSMIESINYNVSCYKHTDLDSTLREKAHKMVCNRWDPIVRNNNKPRKIKYMKNMVSVGNLYPEIFYYLDDTKESEELVRSRLEQHLVFSKTNAFYTQINVPVFEIDYSVFPWVNNFRIHTIVGLVRNVFMVLAAMFGPFIGFDSLHKASIMKFRKELDYQNWSYTFKRWVLAIALDLFLRKSLYKHYNAYTYMVPCEEMINQILDGKVYKHIADNRKEDSTFTYSHIGYNYQRQMYLVDKFKKISTVERKRRGLA